MCAEGGRARTVIRSQGPKDKQQDELIEYLGCQYASAGTEDEGTIKSFYTANHVDRGFL